MSYLFKDTEQAARRLQLLAEVFACSSRSFLHTVGGATPESVLDLGCGPGYTTRLLAEVMQGAQIIGLDTSESFLALARRNAPASLCFVQHDVTQTPFPTGPGDLIFCRMLLTHLRDPLAVLERWGTQLRPGGLLLVEEVEWIQATLLRQHANELYIGPRLAHYQGNAWLTCRLSRVFPLPVSTAQAERLFALNLPSWKQHPFIQQQYGTIIDHVEQELQVLATTPSCEGENMWGMRQLAYERTSR